MSLETHHAEAYVASAVAEVHAVPHNLPIADVHTAQDVFESTTLQLDSDQELTALENQAHAHKVLLSSDAMRFFIAHVTEEKRAATLTQVIINARNSFPSEDGWVVVNLQRMEELVDSAIGNNTDSIFTQKTEDETPATYVPITAGSLAEAIIIGNTQAAYEMIANRPMISLADAASDLDAVYRKRRGEQVSISNMLEAYTRELSNDKLEAVIGALTSALDGTCTDEATAVKMAILKAIKVLE